MTQNFDDEQLEELEQKRQDEHLDDEYWYGYWQSLKEDEAVERHYDKTHEQ